MIRLYCLAQMLKRLEPQEATVLAINNDKYLKLLKMAPYVVPTKNRYQMYQALMLAGIERKALKSVFDDVPTDRTLTRIKNYHTIPDCWCAEGHMLLDPEEYSQVLKDFWFQVLKPLQLGDYPIEEPKPLLMMYWVQRMCRTQPWLMGATIGKLYPECKHVLDVMISVPKTTRLDCLYDWDKEYYTTTKGKYLKHLNVSNYAHYDNNRIMRLHQTRAATVDKILDFYYANDSEIKMFYSFLYNICCYGIANDSLITGEWDYTLYN